jgi:hypothetical protein
MQDLLNNLNPTIAIILIVAGVLALVIVVILIRRLRQRQAPLDDTLGSSPGLSGPVDYTSLPVDDEPSGWRERFAKLSLAGKILIILVPILALLGLLVLVLTLLPSGNVAQQPSDFPIEAPAEASLTVTKADVIRGTPVTIRVAAETTGLDDGTEVTIELLEDGESINFLNPQNAIAQVSDNKIEKDVSKLDAAPSLQQSASYTLRVSTSDGAAAGELELTIPPNFVAAVYEQQAAPTATLTPTTAPTPTALAVEETPEAPTATPVPEVDGPDVSVANGGNVRSLPIVNPNNRIGGVDAGNTVKLLEQTPNGLWYRISFTNTDDGQQTTGWISASLLSISADVATQVPVATIVSVFVNGAVYENPDLSSTERDRVNVDEVVSLKQKTAEGDWYEVENVRGIVGWVPAGLLGIPEDVAAQVPVAE